MIWVLTTEYNEYDQHGGYFLAAWLNMPSLQDIQRVTEVGEAEAYHILGGGGRRGTENQWYYLSEVQEGYPA